MPAVLPGLRGRRGLARLCAGLAVVGVVVAAGQPSVKVEPEGRILELVVDVSNSTQADDLSPTRLGAIQQASLHLLGRVDGEVRVGLVSFATGARTLVRPTTDRDAVRDALAGLLPSGGTAMGDGLQRALDDIQAARPAGPARVLLLSDGANSTGSHPTEAAREAAARNIPILAVAVGTRTGQYRPAGTRLPLRTVPPEPAQLAGLAGHTGGRALQARSSDELEAAVEILGDEAGVLREGRELTLLVVAAVLVLVAGAGLLPNRRPAPRPRSRPLLRRWRWAPTPLLMAAAAAATVAWLQEQPAGPGPAAAVARPDRPRPVPPEVRPRRLPPVPPLTAYARTSGDRRIVEQAGALLRRHRELFQQRQAEIAQHRLNPISALHVAVCDSCGTGSFTDRSLASLPQEGRSCDPLLDLPDVKRVARQARVPVTTMTALAVLHEQELCLAATGGRLAPFTAEQRLARKLGNPRLFDLLYVQIDSEAGDWRTVWQAAGLLREHRELAVQRSQELRRLDLQQLGPLQVRVCRSCLDVLGNASSGRPVTGIAPCEVRLDMAEHERAARHWGLPLIVVTASTLVHEQEHCARHPDDRETPAIGQEMQLARKLGNPRLIQYVTSRYDSLDSSGHWKD